MTGWLLLSSTSWNEQYSHLILKLLHVIEHWLDGAVFSPASVRAYIWWSNQCHLDFFVKCSHRMHSSIILQRYGTSVILNTSLDNNTVRWWSSYTITVMEQDYISLYQRYIRISFISTDVVNSDRYRQSSFQSTSTSTFLDATTSHQSSLIVLKFIVLRKVLL